MRILILGAAGFIGQRLSKALLKQPEQEDFPPYEKEITELIAFDKVITSPPFQDKRLKIEAGDFCDYDTMRQLLDPMPDLIFHLAAIVSGEAEKDFDLGMKVNLHAVIQLLEFCKASTKKPILVFASSCAVFGGDMPGVISDETAPTPQSSYGTEKAIAELLVNDYSRRGFVDGRSLRLPTIVVRPGKPNAATSSFVSSIVREPLSGLSARCPVERETRIYIHSPGKVVQNLVHASTLPTATFGKNRIVTLPGITVSVDEILTALESLAGKKTVSLVEWAPDPFIQSIVMTWPTEFRTDRATKLGFKKDESIKQIIESYIKEEIA
jgi:D-erythronate 2-dehydrogenase